MRNSGKNIKVVINKLNVGYNDEGPLEAPVVIFIHGFPFNKSLWKPQMEALQENFRVIAYDIRGFGESEAGTEHFSMELFANDLILLMDTLKIEKASLCGLSMGGYIAMSAIGKHPKRFESLILSDTQCLADTYEAKEKKMKAAEAINKNGVEKYAEESIKNLFCTNSFNEKKKQIADVREMIQSTSKKSLTDTLFALSDRKSTCSQIQDIEVPVLIIVGREDKITPPSASMLMHERIQGSLLKILEQAGHLANLENSDAFNIYLKNFIQQLAKKPVSSILARSLFSSAF